MAEQRKMNKFIVLFSGAIVVIVLMTILKDKKETYTEIRSLPAIQATDKPSDGDTQADTIRALQAYAKEAVEKSKRLNEHTLNQSQQVEENKNTVSALTRKDQQQNEELKKTKAETKILEDKLQSLSQKIDTIIDKNKQTVDEIPVGFGFDNESEQHKNTKGQWYNPIDVIEEKQGANVPATFNGLLNHPSQRKEKISIKTTKIPPETEKVEPYLTLHKDAILFDSLAFTALIGRIPVEGVTPDPYPVKIFIGKENLLANGFNIPDVDGMVFSGLGIGDWNLSCVSARLYSATFIFNDGRIVNQTEDEPLAYISDRTGVPCVSGRFVSNAKQFITQQVGLSGLGAAGSAYANAQLETTTNNDGDRTTSLIGDISKVVAGNVVKSSTEEVSSWLLARQKNSFEAIVVDPGKRVSIHLQKAIIIDHKEFARKVRYVRHASHPENTLD